MAIHKEALIAKRAYEIWEKAGRPHGLDRDHWLQAISEIEETVTVVNGDAPVHASANSVVSGDAPIHAPTRAAKPPKVATTAPAKTKGSPKTRSAPAKPKKG